MAITTFEPGSDIALVGAVLPLAVAVGREGLMTAGAGVFIDSLAVDLIEMGVPPLIPAGIAAEPFPLPARSLFDGAAALLTYVYDTVKIPAVIIQKSPFHQRNFLIKSGTP